MTRKKTKTLSKNDNLFRLKLPAASENLDIIRKFISGIAANMGFNEDEIYQIELAVDEASANVVKHAYKDESSSEKNIFVTVKRRPARIEITIADHGVGFDPSSLHTPDMEEYLKRMKPGGLGVHLIKTLMDDVKFRINPGVRNEVKMIKNLSR